MPLKKTLLHQNFRVPNIFSALMKYLGSFWPEKINKIGLNTVNMLRFFSFPDHKWTGGALLLRSEYLTTKNSSQNVKSLKGPHEHGKMRAL